MPRSETDLQLRRIWTAQLYKEYATICWQYGVSLKRPVIEISDAAKSWGSWHARTRTIKLSVGLILNHSWDVTVNILKHEMAHQIVTDIRQSAEAHGELFIKACRMLGVPEEFRSASGDLPRELPGLRRGNIHGSGRKILDRVHKLLALAQSHNEHEACLAMRKANQLIAKHNLERIERRKPSRYGYIIINHKKKRIENYQRHICAILLNYFFVEPVFSSLYDPHARDEHKTIELIGAIENVLLAEYVYYFLLNQLHVLWKEHQRRTGLQGSRKRSYWLGVLQGFTDSLERTRQKQNALGAGGLPETVGALVRAEDKELGDFIHGRFPRLRRKKGGAASVHSPAYQAGVDAGRQVVLQKPIQEHDGFRRRLLP